MKTKFKFGRYSLRYAAGQYWLLDMEQSGITYRPPLSLNQIGAEMWMMMEKGLTVEQMTEMLNREYGVPEESIRTDILQFCEDLKRQGFVTEE